MAENKARIALQQQEGMGQPIEEIFILPGQYAELYGRGVIVDVLPNATVIFDHSRQGGAIVTAVNADKPIAHLPAMPGYPLRRLVRREVI